MAWWFVRGLRRGILTTRYPAAAEASAADLPTPPAFRPELLTAELADQLAAACPSGALRRDGAELVYDLGRCTGCGRCIRAGGAVAVASGQFELAATARADLMKRIPVRGGSS
jgi:hypothetical protein